MQNTKQKFRQSFIVFEKQGILCETLTNYLQKLQKTWFLHTCFYTFINNSRSKQSKKNPIYPLVDITKLKTCAKFSKLSGSWTSIKFSIFQTTNLVSWK